MAQANTAAVAAENAKLRQTQSQVAPPDTLDISKVLKAARFVKKLDGTVRSAGAWAEYYSDLRTSTLTSASIRACLTHVESNAEDTLSTPNGTAADHALFTLLQATTTGLAHAIVTGLERSASGYSVSGITALRQLKDSVQPSTLGDFYAAVRAVAVSNLPISARHDPRTHLIRYITEVHTLERQYNVSISDRGPDRRNDHALPSEYDVMCTSLMARSVADKRPTTTEVIQQIQELYTGVLQVSCSTSSPHRNSTICISSTTCSLQQARATVCATS
jgi:hypothetical protein